MNIDLRLIGIILSIITWILSNILFILNTNKARSSYSENPRNERKILIKLYIVGIINFLSVVTLFILKFNLWYVCLFFTDGFAFLIFYLIWEIMEDTLYFIKRLFSFIKETRKINNKGVK